MTEERLVLAELLEKAGEGDFLRAVAEAVLQLLMETDVEGLIGAGRYDSCGRDDVCAWSSEPSAADLEAHHRSGQKRPSRRSRYQTG